MDYLRGFRLLREDPDWLSKIGVGSLLLLSAMIIPFLGQVVLVGWSASIVRRSLGGQDTPLPRLDFDMDHLGKLLGSGFKVFVAHFLWVLPSTMLLVGGWFCMYTGAVMTAVGSAAAGGDTGAGVGLSAMFCVMGVGGPLIVVLAVLAQLPAQMAMLRAELADNLEAGLKPREVIAMTRLVLRELVIGSLVLGMVQWLMTMGSLLLCGLPLIPCTVAMMVARSHFAAQLYQKYLERGGEPLTIAHPAVDGERPGVVAAAVF